MAQKGGAFYVEGVVTVKASGDVAFESKADDGGIAYIGNGTQYSPLIYLREQSNFSWSCIPELSGYRKKCQETNGEDCWL